MAVRRDGPKGPVAAMAKGPRSRVRGRPVQLPPCGVPTAGGSTPAASRWVLPLIRFLKAGWHQAGPMIPGGEVGGSPLSDALKAWSQPTWAWSDSTMPIKSGGLPSNGAIPFCQGTHDA
jgi:hypothetical protein